MVTLLSVSNLVYSSADNSTIDCTITLDAFPNPLPFTASANDVEAHGRQIYADIVSGKWGPIAAYVPPPPKVTTAPSVA